MQRALFPGDYKAFPRCFENVISATERTTQKGSSLARHDDDSLHTSLVYITPFFQHERIQVDLLAFHLAIDELLLCLSFFASSLLVHINDMKCQ